MKIKKFFFVMTLVFTLLGCSSNDESQSGEEYAVKAKELAQLHGMSFEIENPSLMTRANYKELETQILLLKEQFKESVVFNKVEVLNDTVFVTNRNKLNVIKTRSETVKTECKGVTFEVGVVFSSSSDEYSLSYTAYAFGEKQRTSVGKEEKMLSGDTIGFKTTLDVTIKVGGGFLTGTYILEGYINPVLGLGEVKAKQ